LGSNRHRSPRALAAIVAGLAAAATFGQSMQPVHAAGQGRARSSVMDSPGYSPPNDPESLSVKFGRRLNAPVVKMPLGGGRDSIRTLVDAYLQAVARWDTAGARSLCVTQTEFDTILWREFPQSRPITGASSADGWYFLSRRLHGGIARALNTHGGDTLVLVRVESRLSPVAYKNFRLHEDVAIVARDPRGAEYRLDDIRAIVERGGRFKIYSMKD
jgi:hypothetical protein